MDAKLGKYGTKKILNIFYSATDGCDWDSMIGKAKQQCGVEHERVLVMFSPYRPGEVRHERRR